MDDRKKKRSPAWLLVILGLLAAVGLLVGRANFRSPAETQQILDELGIRWTDLGPPVVVFTSPG